VTLVCAKTAPKLLKVVLCTDAVFRQDFLFGKRPQTILISPSLPTSLNQPLTHTTTPTLGKASHITKHPFCPTMQQPPPPPPPPPPAPVPNVANIQAAVNGMTAQGNNIAQDVQAYIGHQQALNTELSRCGNYNVAGINPQLAAIRNSITDLTALISAQ